VEIVATMLEGTTTAVRDSGAMVMLAMMISLLHLPEAMDGKLRPIGLHKISSSWVSDFRRLRFEDSLRMV